MAKIRIFFERPEIISFLVEADDDAAEQIAAALPIDQEPNRKP